MISVMQRVTHYIFIRPGVAGAVLQTPLLHISNVKNKFFGKVVELVGGGVCYQPGLPRLVFGIDATIPKS